MDKVHWHAESVVKAAIVARTESFILPLLGVIAMEVKQQAEKIARS